MREQLHLYPLGSPPLSSREVARLHRFGAETLLKLAPFKWLGRWSYSLYLWHWPILYLAVQRWGHTDTATGLLLAGLAVVVSAATFFGIENPIRHSALLNRTPLISIGFGIILVAACLGVIAVSTT